MATQEQLREVFRAVPFRPVVIGTAGGRSYLVEHPENASWGQSGRDLVVHDKQGMHLLDIRLVDLIEPVASESDESYEKSQPGRPKGGA